MRGWFIVLGLAGCNTVFELSGTEVRGPDFDADGIDTAHDNCPTIANPDQLDSDDDDVGDACDPCPDGPEALADQDGDGLDDACDPCPRGPQHDEDGDGAMDACDDCPAIADATQLDGDGDGIGDVCEDAAGIQHRRLFDGFAVLSSSWLSVDRWKAIGDAATPVHVNNDPINRSLWNPDQPVADRGVLEVALQLPAQPSAAYVGIQLDSDTHGGIAACALRWNGTGWTLQTPSATPVTLPVLPTHQRLRMTYVRNFVQSTMTVTCDAVGAGSATGTTANPNAITLFVELFTQIAAFDYLDVIDSP